MRALAGRGCMWQAWGERVWGQKPRVFGIECVGSQGPAEVTWGWRVGGTRRAKPGLRASPAPSVN